MTYFNAQGQGRVGWRSLVVTQVVNAVDADAQAFISAAGITNLTQASAVNVLVNDLKTYGLWTKMKALYPMVGGTATSHKFNLKDPRDLDAAFRLTFSGGWTHSSTGALPNGTTGYAETYFNPTTGYSVNNSAHISFYSRTNASEANDTEMGCYDVNNLVITTRRSDQSNKTFLFANTNNGINFVDSDSLGLYVSNRINNQANGFKNGVSKGSNTVADNARNNRTIVIGANNATGFNITQYSSRQSAFSSIGDGLTDTEAANFYNSVQKFQTTLGRQIGSPIVSDTDAQAFINAAGLTDLGQANAVNTLVVDLKASGVWTKMKALYPFVGGTATTHKWNLKDPRDLDAAFRIVFNGGMTHTSLGMVSNYTTSYADTRLTPSTALSSLFSQHVSVYSQTSTASPTNNTNSIGEYQDGTRSMLMKIRNLSNVFSWEVGNGGASVSNTDGKGFYLGSVVANNSVKLYKNNTNVATNTATFTGSLPTQMQPIGKNENKTFSFASIGDGLTDADATAFYTAVQKYQTTLGRQIGTPVLAEGQTAGLLETYSGAAAAYSLRKLRTGYVGNAIRVRRSSDNAEQDIAFDASGNLDTVSLLAFVGSGNGFVTTWYDQSGYNNHIIQTTAANQPQVVSSGSVILDGTKPAVQFNGTTTTLNATFSGVTISGLNNMAVICACKTTFNNAGVSPLGLMYFGPDTGWGQVSLSLQAQNVRYRFGTGQSSNNPSYNYSSFGSLFSKTLLSTYHQGVNEVLRINGSDRLTYNNKLATIANTGNQFGMGGNYTSGSMLYHQGTISEMIIYVNDQMSNRAPIESNINSFYSIY